MTSGQLVPDALIVALVKDHLVHSQPEGSLVFDGFPRTAGQASELTEMLNLLGKGVDMVIVLQAEEQDLVERISGRRSCPDCKSVYNIHSSPPEKLGFCDVEGSLLIHRTDDNPETVLSRLQVYRSETEPVVHYYEELGSKVYLIDGSKGVDEVRTDIAQVLELATA